MKTEMKTLENLYLGHMKPNEKENHSQEAKILDDILETLRENLIKTLNDEQKELFDKFGEAYDDVMFCSEKYHYIDGFINGSRMTYEVLMTEL